MLQLQNTTPFTANMALFPDDDGVDTLYIVVKGTFNIGKQWTLAKTQIPPVEADTYWTEPGKSSIKYASDMHTGKPATDILMLGHAFAPDGHDVHQLDVKLSVAQVSKTVRVFGDRSWKDGQITLPKPFKTMAMVYEKAFGGMHMVDGQIIATELRNPVGRGFVGQRTAKEMNGVPLPNLEDPANLISSLEQQPVPACFGVTAPHWQPRSSYAGTYDDIWQTTRAPYLPQDFDKRFFNMAHPDLIFPGFLQGGEAVEITHMHPSGTLRFNLPRVNLKASVTVGATMEQPRLQVETLLLEPNRQQLSMVWRTAVQCDKKALKISNINISMTR